jgi:hypothetical protein
VWYNINGLTDVDELIVEMKYNISDFILPFFEKLNTVQKLINELEISEEALLHTAAKMTFFSELKNANTKKYQKKNIIDNN